MRREIVLYSLVAGMIMASCGNSARNSGAISGDTDKLIKQHEDGTISLTLANADRYSDIKNPSCNTAEWKVIVSKSGRYNVWLTSATKDTNDLKYKNSVMICVQDTKIVGRPGCDKIIYNSSDVNYPWFRAESFMGAMYIQDTGVFHVQVNSEQILPEDIKSNELSGAELSKLISVSFTPVTR
jgi:hypothetical protein